MPLKTQGKKKKKPSVSGGGLRIFADQRVMKFSSREDIWAYTAKPLKSGI